jgi:hypothetical protein
MMLGNIEKDFMVDLIRCYAALYLVEILGFCIIGNHLFEILKSACHIPSSRPFLSGIFVAK